ncbi:MAG: DNA polymerase III subunit gamma/tau [Desulfobacterales bacterium]|nr:DNA polymerase III subunit gamma/tau [Desulfobacterales bacterium]
MSYLVFARKYRPQTFDQVVQQDHVTRTLKNAISSKRVAHAILFSGPRGTGKTTVARILAKAMNCRDGPAPVPCNQCQSCREVTSGGAADVFEIDGASNNSVDQIRQLRENIKYMPAHSPYKIYIIDEVHMLSSAAFNALLKTLEEPPAHILFMFATTEVHKIPVTVLSRCQRHEFRRIDISSLAGQMKMICSKEGVEVADESLWLMAREAGGSMRDALSLLDQVTSSAESMITQEHVLNILGIIDRKMIFDISRAIFGHNIPMTLEILDQVFSRGIDMKKLYGDLLEHFRNLLIVKMGKTVAGLVDVPAHEIDMMRAQVQDIPITFLHQIFNTLFQEEPLLRFSPQAKLALEMVFIKLDQINPALPIDTLIEKLDGLRKELMGNRAKGADRPQPEPQNDREEAPGVVWEKILGRISENHPSLAAYLNQSSLTGISDNRLEIEVTGNEFNLNMLRKDKNLEILKKIFSDFFGREMELVLTANMNRTNHHQVIIEEHNKLKQEALSHPLVSETLEVFSGRVVDVKVPK